MTNNVPMMMMVVMIFSCLGEDVIGYQQQCRVGGGRGIFKKNSSSKQQKRGGLVRARGAHIVLISLLFV